MTALTEPSVIDMALRHVGEIARLESITFSSPWSEKSLTECVEGENTLFLVCEAEGNVLGYVGCYTVSTDAAITNVAVFPEYRRQGIGEALICELIKRARERGCEILSLEVRVSNDPAIKLYEKLGFSIAGKRKNFYTEPREDAYVMIYDLKE